MQNRISNPIRNLFAHGCSTLAVLLFASTSFGQAPAKPAPIKPSTKSPNVLILYADDLGFGDLGSFNPDSKIPTPNLDRLASQGMRFVDGHSSSGICSPSRYALLTGRHHWRDFHGIVNVFGKSVFNRNELRCPKCLRRKGIARRRSANGTLAGIGTR